MKALRNSLFVAVGFTILVGTFALHQTASARDRAAKQHWVGTWSTSPGGVGQGFRDETLRQIVHISIGGKWLRVRFSNSFGTESLVIDAATIAIRKKDDKIKVKSLRELTFGGEVFITIPPGARVLSDAVELKVADEADLAVSLYVDADTGTSTVHSSAHQTSFISPGDLTADEDMPGAVPTTSWFWLTGVEVWADRDTHAVVTLGDSITDGTASTTDADARYPDALARRLLKDFRGKLAVLNEGIGGNRVLNDGNVAPFALGPNALARLDRDVLTQSGVTDVILLEGVNDIGFPDLAFPLPNPFRVSAEEIIAGYKQIIERVHARGLKIFVGTIVPYREFAYWTPAGEDKRQAVNAFIRTTDLHDGFIDFDKAIRQKPPNDDRMRPEFDSGDNLHPNDAGYERMGKEAARVLRRDR
jgi:lysophospholipase L1-like esterase